MTSHQIYVVVFGGFFKIFFKEKSLTVFENGGLMGGVHYRCTIMSILKFLFSVESRDLTPFPLQ